MAALGIHDPLSRAATTADRRRASGAPTVRERLRAIGPHGPALLVLLGVALALRLWGIKQGLPYSYNLDEAQHFVPRAIAYFAHDWDPHYFQNPPAFSYLIHIVFELWFGSGDATSRAFAANPTAVYVVARAVVAVLGTISVLLLYLTGARLFGRTAGLIAAAIMTVAFPPVFYSHLALNDVPTLAPVTLGLYATAGVMRRGRRRDYVLGGVATGLAAATKYTGGYVIACLLVATVQDASGGSVAQSARRFALAVAAAVLAFVLANPYALLQFGEFTAGLSEQASQSAGSDPVKLGSHGDGFAYYLWSLTWGLGWIPALAALAGAVLLAVRRRIGLGLLLIPAPIAFAIFMGDQQRFFGRWIMPIFPVLALLAAYAVLALVRGVAARTGVRRWVLAPAAVAVLLAQGVVTSIHGDAVLSRPDTRNLARAWMVGHVPAGARVVIEPLVPDTWANDIGRSLPWTGSGERWVRFPTWTSDIGPDGRPLPPGRQRFVVVDQYERVLRPALLDRYERQGFCWVLIGSLQAGRAFSAPAAAPQAIAYYTALADRAKRVFHVSPFAAGAQPIPFSFDWSIDYYPRQFRRPGPELSLYHLTGVSCRTAP